MTGKKRYILSDFFWEVLDTKYDWFGNTEPFSKEVIEEEDYLCIGRTKTQEDGEKICNLLNKLTEKNEQLKSTMKEVAELLEEEVDLFSDKATEHDMCAYIELNKLDNKDAYYMATSTKKAIKMLKELEE